MNKLIFISLAIVILQNGSAYAGRVNGLKTLVATITGSAVAESFANGTEFSALEEQTNKLANQIRKHHPELKNPTVYCLYFSVDNGVFSGSRWADIDASGADLFAKISVNGADTFIIPELIRNNQGQPITLKTVTEEIPGNSKVTVTLYDDDSNPITSPWDGIIKSRKTIKTGMEIGNVFSALKVTSGKKIQILNTSTVIDKPDHIASVKFTVPTTDGKWNIDGTIKDRLWRTVGKIQFAKCLSSEELANTQSKLKTKKVFWFALGSILAVITIRYLVKKIV